MKLVPYEISKLKTGRKIPESNYLIFKEFLEGDNDCVRLDGHGYSHVNSAQTTLQKSADRYFKNQIRVTSKDGDVFLVKTSKIRKAKV